MSEALVRHLAFKVVTWAGLRGAISLAFARSIPPSENRDLILTLLYSVGAFSVLFQGLTLRPLLVRLGMSGATPETTKESH